MVGERYVSGVGGDLVKHVILKVFYLILFVYLEVRIFNKTGKTRTSMI